MYCMYKCGYLFSPSLFERQEDRKRQKKEKDRGRSKTRSYLFTTFIFNSYIKRRMAAETGEMIIVGVDGGGGNTHLVEPELKTADVNIVVLGPTGE